MSSRNAELAVRHLEVSRERLRLRMQLDGGSTLPFTATLLAGAGRELLRPLSRRHPVALVATAFAAGALLVAVRPWRTFARSALLAAMLSRLGSQLVAQLPLNSWLTTLQDAAMSYVRSGSAPIPPARPDS